MARNYCQIAEKYEEGVLDGTILVGARVKKAVERQRADLKKCPTGYEWDDSVADKACALAEQMAFPKGKKKGQKFKLEPWQCWLLRVIFGWIDSVDGLPRFRNITIFLPKGNGKSPLAAMIGLITLCRGKSIGAKVYCAATTQKQADNVFDPAKEMLRLAPDLEKAAGLVVGEHAIKGVGDSRTFERVSAEKRSADGTVGDCYIVDEIHQHPNRNLYDVLANNASKVDGSRIVVISTAGTDQTPTAIGWQLYCEARDILDKKLSNPAVFAFISEADREMDPWAEKTWMMANPNYGVSVSIAGFKNTALSAKAQPMSQPHFFATRLGWWSQNASGWLDLGKWRACARKLTDQDFEGRPIFIGVDLATVKDFSAKVQVAVKPRPDGENEYYVRTLGYIPEQSQTVIDIPETKEWVKAGWLKMDEGSEVLSIALVREDIVADMAKYSQAKICVDPFGATSMFQDLQNLGHDPIAIRQGWKDQSPAMHEIEAAVLKGRLFHDGSPLMELCIGNVIAIRDRNGNATPNRENDAKKIDLAVGLINAMSRAMVAEPVSADFDMTVVDFNELGASQWAS